MILESVAAKQCNVAILNFITQAPSPEHVYILYVCSHDKACVYDML